MCRMILLFIFATTGALELGRGWNYGNVLEEAPPATKLTGEWTFESVKARGFDWVRIPVQWDSHTATTSPYLVDPEWLATVNQTVRWALKHGLKAMINSHHETWLDNATTFPTMLPRLVAIWEQVAHSFASVSSNLVFELLNEPNYITIDQLNEMNSALLAVIRPTNPTRQIHFGGLKKMGAWWIVQPQNWGVITFPPNDTNLALTVHSYAPYDFAGPSPIVDTYTSKDQAKADETMATLGNWSHNSSIPVVLDEFGCTVQQRNSTARYLYYQTTAAAATQHGLGWAVWDDNGWFRILDRTTQEWDAQLLETILPNQPAPPADCATAWQSCGAGGHPTCCQESCTCTGSSGYKQCTPASGQWQCESPTPQIMNE